MAEPIIKLENVWKIYQLGKVELIALKRISLEVAPGAFVTIMGPSGSGKSTLLNMVGALDSPTRGKVFLKGEDISLLTEDQLSQLRGKTIGFVFQEFNLLPNLTAIENVMLPMIFQGTPLEKRKEKAKELLISLGLEDRISHQPAELSGGERQRVAIARAFANNPEMVIADEPTGNLDSITGKKIMEVLVDFHQKQGKTIVVVTHDPHIAEYSEEIVNIKDGEIIINHQQAAKVLWSK
ncbi:MAG: ABC transporter ATP-binding protein [Candidatus Nealsonbacteria bacterium]|nr:MAG: ABC transporter ATP-binding protein [Candidatus Nealsonbacteria bacterium]